MLENQLGKRNAHPNLLSYIRGKMYLNEKGRGHFVPGRTREVLAAKTNVSDKTIQRDAKFAQAVDAMPDYRHKWKPIVAKYLMDRVEAVNEHGVYERGDKTENVTSSDRGTSFTYRIVKFNSTNSTKSFSFRPLSLPLFPAIDCLISFLASFSPISNS